MYAKLFSRITESSLMEESIPTRYVFVMMLAIADPEGYVIGTDVALARRLNIALAEFRRAVARLTAPDPDSNSPAEDGRRLLPSDGERGYKLVNFLHYRSMRDEDGRREYMREYMAVYRKTGKPVNSESLQVNSRKPCKPPLAQAEGDEEGEGEGVGEYARAGKSRGETELPTVEQAIASVMTCGIPDDFTRYVYEDWASREGRDGSGQVVGFVRYACKRWSRERKEWAAGTHKGTKPVNAGVPHPITGEEAALKRIRAI